MASRPRCANCGKAFTPNCRNQTKRTGRQRVCPECGPIIGHRLADKRYREDSGRSRRKVRPPRSGSSIRPQSASPPTVFDSLASPPVVAAATGTPGSEFAARIGRHLVAIAALVNGAKPPDGCGALEPLPERIFEESSSVASERVA